MSNANKRYLIYAFITLFILVVPFVRINGNHLLLLSFEKFEFHFVGFAFSVSEFYVMPFLLMFLFIGIIATTSILGRVWCGWACPQTIFRVIYRDLIEGTLLDMRRVKNKQKEKNYSKAKTILLKTIAVSLWGVLALMIATNFLLYFVPYEDFFTYLNKPSEHILMIVVLLSIALFLLFDIVYLKENFCTYICPYSSTQTVLYDDETKHVIYNTNRDQECTTCEACVKICPTHIDIRKGLQLECINCLECCDACTKVMGKLGKESLIEWGSTKSVLKNTKINFFNKKNIMLSVVLVASLLFALLLASEKEYVLATAEKSDSLYRIDENNVVYNSYVLAIHNIQEQTYTYDVKIQNDPNFRIRRFNPPQLEAGQRKKKILIVETTKVSSISKYSNTTYKLELIVFAKEDPKIQTITHLAFIYPQNTK
ncbi:MAG: cytochrome c oxidase accessory protein CcoG [Helicobacteraceae bacterium]|nr:cytochrome c oxidase accessory protein CcoG [Helicobacteraceae bacterium]